jgi:hypothetical protein
MDSEKIVEPRLIKEVLKLGGLCFKWVSPGTRGVCDRICIFPNGGFELVETKSTGKDLDPLQKLFKKRVESRGHRVWKIDSVVEVLEFIEYVKIKYKL